MTLVSAFINHVADVNDAFTHLLSSWQTKSANTKLNEM